jgi:hypothetical protein
LRRNERKPLNKKNMTSSCFRAIFGCVVQLNKRWIATEKVVQVLTRNKNLQSGKNGQKSTGTDRRNERKQRKLRKSK